MNNAEHTYTLPTGVTTITVSMLDEIRAQKHITHVIIPDGVTSIGECAFSGCYSLTTIDIPERVTSIGLAAFTECSSLTTITIPDSVTSIGLYAFRHCISLTTVTIPGRVTSISDMAISESKSQTSLCGKRAQSSRNGNGGMEIHLDAHIQTLERICHGRHWALAQVLARHDNA